ncbi:hypothetical protein EJ02DRAFT_184549 [Clathrospora elynae]|uniref:Uncharacterized protein n=1 Tax=Clathrospora elynae TaxID=706981 RepID=A0A6A5SYT4_9PLEO|nr:hypothetical protein EJ02DRAFT_184549 [Clathrospora elynae]
MHRSLGSYTHATSLPFCRIHFVYLLRPDLALVISSWLPCGMVYAVSDCIFWSGDCKMRPPLSILDAVPYCRNRNLFPVPAVHTQSRPDVSYLIFMRLRTHEPCLSSCQNCCRQAYRCGCGIVSSSNLSSLRALAVPLGLVGDAILAVSAECSGGSCRARRLLAVCLEQCQIGVVRLVRAHLLQGGEAFRAGVDSPERLRSSSWRGAFPLLVFDNSSARRRLQTAPRCGSDACDRASFGARVFVAERDSGGRRPATMSALERRLIIKPFIIRSFSYTLTARRYCHGVVVFWAGDPGRGGSSAGVTQHSEFHEHESCHAGRTLKMSYVRETPASYYMNETSETRRCNRPESAHAASQLEVQRHAFEQH